MTHKPEEASTEEELDALVKSGGFRLVKSDFTKALETFLSQFGAVSTPLCTLLPDGGILPYAILKRYKGVTAADLEKKLRALLGQHGLVNFCTCQELPDDIIVINGYVRPASDRVERLDVVRSRRHGRPKSKE